MKVFLVYLAFLVLLLVLIPYFVTSCNYTDSKYGGDIVSVYNHYTQKTENISLEDYIISVVCAEMPASFEPEALKAQAVAARTYALKKINSQSPEHKGAQVCTDHAHCQAYASYEDLKEKWGSDYRSNLKKVTSAVKSTSGEYVGYEGDYATTVFHSCSNGVTEKSADVWGGEIPYLVNVESPGDTNKPDYEKVYEFGYDDFVNKLKTKTDTMVNEAAPAIGNITQSTGGNVLKIELFGKPYSGVDIRSIYNLSSTSFILEQADNVFKFTVWGSGHGVGMSQYGANAMAQNGKSYKDIISHYYPGTNIQK